MANSKKKNSTAQAMASLGQHNPLARTIEETSEENKQFFRDNKDSDYHATASASEKAFAKLNSLKSVESKAQEAYNKAREGADYKFEVDKLMLGNKTDLKKALKNYKGDEHRLVDQLFTKIDKYHPNTASVKDILSCVDTMQMIVANLRETVKTSKNPFAKLRSANLLKALDPVYTRLSQYQIKLGNSKFDNKTYQSTKEAYELAKSDYRKASKQYSEIHDHLSTLATSMFDKSRPLPKTPDIEVDLKNKPHK